MIMMTIRRLELWLILFLVFIEVSIFPCIIGHILPMMDGDMSYRRREQKPVVWFISYKVLITKQGNTDCDTTVRLVLLFLYQSYVTRGQCTIYWYGGLLPALSSTMA